MRKLRSLNVEEELEIIEKIKTKKRKDIISEYGISDRHYKSVLNKYGIKLKEKVQKYNFNENYFEKIDTEDKAYFLGFIVADGCLHGSSNNLKIIQKETEILYKFKNYIKFEGPIFTSKTRNISNIGVSSEKIISDLNNLGIRANKTMNVTFPNISNNLLHHFMRGVFDGDGCISIHKDSRDGSERGQVNICSGSLNFIEKYVYNLTKFCGVKRNKIRCPKGTYYVIDWGGLSDVEKLYSYFYKDANVYLERKKKTFDKVILINGSKIKYRKI